MSSELVPPPLTVVFTTNDRPEYLRATLESWSKVRGVDRTNFIFSCEPSYECVQLCRAFEGVPASVEVFENTEKLGSQRNPNRAILLGFGRPEVDYVILAEDDFVVSTDILEYHEWAREQYRDEREMLMVCASTQSPSYQRYGPSAVVVEHRFGWVWGTWRDRWTKLLEPDWTFNYEARGWDWRIIEYWLGGRGYYTVTPACSRVSHIGRYGGTHCTPEMFESVQSAAFLSDVDPQSYYEAVSRVRGVGSGGG